MQTPTMLDHPMVLLVEDTLYYKQQLEEDLKRFPGLIDFLEPVTNVEEALDAIEELVPDLVLLDLKLPRRHGAFDDRSTKLGMELLRSILMVSPHTRVLVLSAYEDETLYDALEAGAVGFIAK